MALQHLRTSTAHKRPIPSVMSAGQLAVNINEASPGLFFKDSNGDLVKVGPVHIGTDAPNSSPASVAATALVTGTVYQILTVGTSDFTGVGASANTVGTVFTATGTTTGTGIVSGQQGVEKGEQWLDTTGGTYVLKIYDGTAWRSESGTFVDVNGDTMTGALLLDNASSAAAPDLSFDGNANTGIYSPGADQVAISTGGAGRLFIDNVGNVGAGTSSPESKFHARADGNDLKALLFLQNRNGGASSGVQISLSNALNDQSENRLAYIRALSTGASQNGNHLTFGTNPNGGPPVERMRIDSSGNVGIGTTSPQRALVVSDAGTEGFEFYPGSSAGNNTVNHYNRSTASFVNIITTADQHIFGRADGEKMRIDSSGNVGIGTTSPRGNLHLHSSSATRFDLTNTATGTTSGDGSTISIDGSTGALNIIQREAQPIIFNTSNTQVARIDSSGRLLVQSSSAPTQGLYSQYAPLTVQGYIGSTTGNGILNIARGTTASLLSSDSDIGTVVFSDSSGGEFGRISCFADAAPSSNDYPGRISFHTTADGASSPTERMRIDSAGNVRIGENGGAALTVTKSTGTGFINVADFYASAANQSPLFRLISRNAANTGTTSVDIVKQYQSGFRIVNADTDSTNFTSLEVGVSERMRIDSSGNVGIGETSVSAGLDVKRDVNPVLAIDRGTANTANFNLQYNGTLTGQLGAADSLFQISAAGASTPMAFYANSAERMRINSSGQVAIGTTSFSEQLTVIGSTLSKTSDGQSGAQLSSDGAIERGSVY